LDPGLFLDFEAKMDTDAVLEVVRTWSREDRLELASRIWDQLIDDGWQPQPTGELEAELERRLAAHMADPTRVVTLAQLVEHVRRRQHQRPH
jgi:putative addiction module component (TIGR02574 family)